MGNRALLLGCVLFAFGGSLCPPAGAQEHRDQKLAHHLMTGWRSEREKLATGRATIAATHRRGKQEVTVTNRYSFDHTIGSVRTVVHWEKMGEGVWLLTPEYLAQCNLDSSPIVALIKPTDPTMRIYFVLDLDPRWFGMAVIGDYDRPPSFDQVAARPKRYNLEKVTQPTPETSEIEWSEKTDKLLIRHTVVINPSRGFSCERYKVLTQAKQQASVGAWTVASDSVAQWAQKNGTWVPESVRLQGLGTHQLAIAVKWESVNEPLPADEFSIDNMGVPVGSKIADSRLSLTNPVLVGRVGEKTSLPPPPRPLSPVKYFRPWTIGVAALLLVATISFLFIWRRKAAGRRIEPAPSSRDGTDQE